ncbi:MAG TPA: PilZ domain-containing protein [Desulfobacterales bacterium]|nr:PilZ domain-containing protein [Desulfobacterales bacterium]
MGSNEARELPEGGDHRQHTRVETCNLISFLSVDEDGRVLRQGMGRALDVSQNGMLLESALPVDSEFVSLMSTDPENNLIEITAKVAYSRRGRTGSFLTGVQFAGAGDDNVRFAANLIKTFHYRRKKSASSDAAPA